MRWVSFDVYRTLGFDNTLQLKPAAFFEHKDAIAAADWVIFPEYWQVNALVFGLGSRIFPSLSSYLLGHNKIEMTRALSMVRPGSVPHTEIAANTPHEAERVWQNWVTPFVAKLPKSSQGAGVWLIESQFDWQRYLGLTDTIYVQEYLPIDRDIRVVVVGDDVLGAYWRLQSCDGFHNNLSRGGIIDCAPVPEAATSLVLEVARSLGINHAGFDVAMVGGHPYILEFNRLFGTRGALGSAAASRAIFDYLVRSTTSPGPEPAPAKPSLKRVA